MIYLFISLGGALGALTRFWIGSAIQSSTRATYPWGTFVVNLTGCLFLGLALRLIQAHGDSASWRAFLLVGFAGAYTTFSTFGLETVGLLDAGKLGPALLYVTSSVALGVLAVWAGLRLG